MNGWRDVSVYCEGRIQVRHALVTIKQLTRKLRQLKIIKVARG
jgi:hypothetical protein